MERLARVTSRFLADYGFSIGIADVQPTPRLTAAKAVLLNSGYEACSGKITQFESGKLTPSPGCTAEQVRPPSEVYLTSLVQRLLGARPHPSPSASSNHRGTSMLELLSRFSPPSRRSSPKSTAYFQRSATTRARSASGSCIP
eukprot:scaffold166949_cov32-Tisochrysis_lutea.AAC.6